MALPKEPRQKMINLMYLVLIALLALNVSAEVLNAFKTVNESIRNSNKSISEKNDLVYREFTKQMGIDPARVGPIKAKADQVRLECAQMNLYIDSVKKLIVQASGGLNDSGQIKDMSNLDAASRIMENQKNGLRLENRLKQLRQALLSNYDPSQLATVSISFPLKEPVEPRNSPDNKRTWTQANFDMVPTIAAVTILSKFQNDIKNSESQVIDDLYKKVGEQNFVFNKYQVLISANSGYLMTGEKYTANIILGAYSTTVKPTIRVDGQVIPVQNGVGTFTTVASGVGQKSYNVSVDLVDQNGKLETYSGAGSYTVGASSVSVSADKMNVLYIGVDNPISVAAAGVPAESIHASITQGSLAPTGPGKYLARVSTQGQATVNVSGMIQGSIRSLGTMVFRTKLIPDPVAEIGGSKGGMFSSAAFRVQQGVSAILENFEFDARFLVTSFEIGFDGTGFPNYMEKSSSSALFTPGIKQLMARCRPGTRVYIDNIRAKGPDGTTRNLPPIAFKLN